MANKTNTAKKLQEVINAKTVENLQKVNTPSSETVKASKNQVPKEVKTTKAETSKKVSKKKNNLVEEVISKREVKYLYPADCNDPLLKKKFRQEVRNKLHKLELIMLRIEDKTSKEYKVKEKEYRDYRKQYIKDGATA